MTRPMLRYTMTALATLALGFSVANSAVAGMRVQHMQDEFVSGVKGHSDRGGHKYAADQKPRQSQDHDAKINAIRNVRSSTTIISGFNSLER